MKPTPTQRLFIHQSYTGLEKLKEIKRPLNQIAINYIRQKDGIASVLVGCRTVEQTLLNIESVNWELSQEQLASIENIFSEEYLKTTE